ncbi:MAG: T9SS type A sorting domain-containing protein [Bacteroidota bacterium]|nr:T9SS type A sorting domain-containing protein [Bacteroidota bacterium]
MRKILLSISVLITISMSGQITDCSELFISEYVEGSGNNKALEIYNPTSNTIDLSSYIVIRYSNGATSASSANAIQLVGDVSPDDVHVGVIEKLNPSGVGNEVPVADALQVKADAFYCPDYNTSNAWYWNGNDAIVLAKGSVSAISNAIIVDVFGKVGEDPIGGWTNIASSGFTSSGYSWTQDHTLIRKSTVLSGDTDPVDLFNAGLEWDSIPEDTWDNLGSHACDCAGSTAINDMDKVSYTLYPNPVNQGASVTVKSNIIIKKIITTNILGEQVNFDNSINTNALAKGIYIVGVEFSNGMYSNSKLIIN